MVVTSVGSGQALQSMRVKPGLILVDGMKAYCFRREAQREYAEMVEAADDGDDEEEEEEEGQCTGEEEDGVCMLNLAGTLFCVSKESALGCATYHSEPSSLPQPDDDESGGASLTPSALGLTALVTFAALAPHHLGH